MLNKEPYNITIDRLLYSVYKKEFNLKNGDLLKIPPNLYCLFELESLQNLCPSYTTNYFLCYHSTYFFDLK